MVRRDKIVEQFQKLIAEKGERKCCTEIRKDPRHDVLALFSSRAYGLMFAIHSFPQKEKIKWQKSFSLYCS